MNTDTLIYTNGQFGVTDPPPCFLPVLRWEGHVNLYTDSNTRTGSNQAHLNHEVLMLLDLKLL